MKFKYFIQAVELQNFATIISHLCTNTLQKASVAAVSQVTYQTAHPELLTAAILSWHIYVIFLPKLGRLKQGWNMPV